MPKFNIKVGDKIRVNAHGIGFSAYGWRTVTKSSKGRVCIRANGYSDFVIERDEITGHKPLNPTKSQRKKALLELSAKAYSAIDALRNAIEFDDSFSQLDTSILVTAQDDLEAAIKRV